MKYFKVTRILMVPAGTKSEVKEKVEFYGEAEFLEFESVKELLPENKGLLGAIKAQILG